MTTLALRLAAPDNIGLLTPLVEAYHAFEGIELAPLRRREALERLLADRRFGAVWFIVETPEGAGRPDVIGYVALCLGYSIEFAGIDSFVDELFLIDAARGRGVGARVLEMITDEARRLGVCALHLEVDRENGRALRLYERSGFRRRERFMLMSRLL